MRGKFAGRTGLKTQGLTGAVTGVFVPGEIAETRLKGRNWPDTHSQPTSSSGGVVGLAIHSPEHAKASGPVFVNAGVLS